MMSKDSNEKWDRKNGEGCQFFFGGGSGGFWDLRMLGAEIFEETRISGTERKRNSSTSTTRRKVGQPRRFVPKVVFGYQPLIKAICTKNGERRNGTWIETTMTTVMAMNNMEVVMPGLVLDIVDADVEEGKAQVS